MANNTDTLPIASATFPPFSYGNAVGGNVYPMTPGNAAPGLAVWLFLTTSPDFLDALDAAQGSNPNLVTASDIADATNLTPECVTQILDQYRNSPNQSAYRTITAEFQAYARTYGAYPRTNCPNGAVGLDGVASTEGKTVILNLAKSGAAVDPSAP